MIKRLFLVLVLVIGLCGCAQKTEDRFSDEKMILQNQEAYIMYDHTVVSQWTMGMMKQDYYCVEADGKLEEILVVDHPAGPESMVHAGLSFDDLNETAKEAIGAYYDQQGLLYDVALEVQDAYEAFEQLGDNFKWHYISQTVWPTGATEKVIAFCTELIQYRGEEEVYQTWDTAIFDRETGERISLESIFVVSEEEAKELILDCLMPEELGRDEKDLRVQMEEAFRFGYIKLMNDGIEVMFPANTLECKEKGFGGFIPAEDLAGIMQPWAMDP